MNILVIGSGAREHVIVWKLSQSKRVSHIYCAPGNPGMESLGTLVALKATDLEGLRAFATEKAIDLTIVGPEQPLAEGIVDLFTLHRLAIFGPSKNASELEWSKAFAKDFMSRHNIPTAGYRVFRRGEIDDARAHVTTCALPVVLKADGLAAGKGVLICRTREEAVDALHTVLEGGTFGRAGNTLVVEEFMEGEEASVFALTDGSDFLTLAPAQDHKRVFDDDRGKNTGGMGAYAPASIVSPDMMRVIHESIIAPTLGGMKAEGRPYRGCLYVGLMITADGPKVVEYNCRFGDPETQVVLPIYEGDILPLFLATQNGEVGKLKDSHLVRVASGSAVCVVLASGGYPDAYATGMEIRGLDRVQKRPGIMVFHAGTRRVDDRIESAGGRVLGITAVVRSGSVRDAIDAAYSAVRDVTFEGMHYRRDIGKKGVGD